MPELPEVETVRRGLAPRLTGATIARAVAHRADLRFALPERFAERLTGAVITALERRAKYLLFRLDRGETLVAHLGMSGRFLLVDDADGGVNPGRFYFEGPLDPKHTHVELLLYGGGMLIYNDPRRFGYMAMIVDAALAAHPYFAGLGPEPLSPVFTAEALGRALAGRRQPIKSALLDQRTVAGLGNIYVCEALFAAGIAPQAPAGTLRPAALARLVRAIRRTLREAIAAGGSTLRDFTHADGGSGAFQQAFAVYDREGAPCPRPGCDGTIARESQSGRSSFYCPRCQVMG